MQNPQRSFSGRRTTGTKTDTLPRTARSWSSPADMRAHPAGKLGEGATAVTGAELCERLFQSTPPRGGRHRCSRWARPPTPYFNPRPPARGGDSAPPPRPCGPWYFNPRPPRGGRRLIFGSDTQHLRHFNPRPPRGGRRNSEPLSTVMV